jgi:hypothetical protein
MASTPKKPAAKPVGKVTHKQSAVIKHGTGSGIHPKAGSTHTADSSPADKHTQGRKGSVKALA